MLSTLLISFLVSITKISDLKCDILSVCKFEFLIMKHNWLLYLILILGVPLNAKVRLPSIIGDNMVLQRNAIVNLWGWSDSKNEVVIQTSWQESSISTKVDDWGEWQIQIKTPEAGGPFVIEFDDGEKLVIKNVYVGEVWLCSGQSNMEMPVKGFYGQPVTKSLSVTAEAHSDIPIRMFTVEKKASVSLEKMCQAFGIYILLKVFLNLVQLLIFWKAVV